MKIRVDEAAVLSALLNRKKRRGSVRFEINPGVILKEIPTRANKLVPSESGSFLLDDSATSLGKSRACIAGERKQ